MAGNGSWQEPLSLLPGVWGSGGTWGTCFRSGGGEGCSRSPKHLSLYLLSGITDSGLLVLVQG